MQTTKDPNTGKRDNKTIKTIKIELTEQEFNQVSEQAKRMKLSLKKYAKMRVLDQEPGPDMRCRQIMQLMPLFYLNVEKVEEDAIQHTLLEIGGRICQYLK